MKRYKPLVDKLYFIISIPTALLLLATTLVLAFLEPLALFWLIPVDIFSSYFLISPLWGYVELRERVLFIKYGFILKREIPYEKIRKIERERKWYSETMLSLKNSLEHVNIKYNSFDVTAVSVKDNDGFVQEIEALRRRIAEEKR